MKAALPILRVRDSAKSDLFDATEELRGAVASVRASFDWLMLLLGVFTAYAMLRSLLYSLALKVFDVDAPVFVKLGTGRAVSRTPPRVAAANGDKRNELVFPDVTAEFPLVTRVLLKNQVLHNARLPPWMFSGVVARVLLRKYYRYVIGGPDEGRLVTWTRPTEKSIADWQLEPGETVVFNFRNFEGASKHIRLESFISLRLDTLLFERFCFALATAPKDKPPAHLLLSAKTFNPEAVSDESGSSCLVEALVAWSINTEFQVRMGPSKGALFLDPYRLRWRQTSPTTARVLVDEDPVRISFGPVWRFLRPLMPI